MNTLRTSFITGVISVTLVSSVQTSYANELMGILMEWYSQFTSGVEPHTEKPLPEWCRYYYEEISKGFVRRVYVGENCPEKLQEESKYLTNEE